MGILSPKEEMMQIALTDHGKKLLSQGKLIVKYYAFADDEIDYGLREGTLLSPDTIQNVISGSLAGGNNPPPLP